VLGPYAPDDEGNSRPVFGVFPLSRKPNGCGF
jgi:hypothetical protein